MALTAKRYRLIALLNCIGMFLVLIVGVLVTNTKSGRGCGTDWPLCNGKFVPAYTIESMVEYSHRAVSGIVGLLVVAAFLATVLWKPASRKEPIWYASGALFFTFLQAALGAMAVIWPTSSAVLAFHFGISMFAFTCTWLLYSYAKRMVAGNEASSGAAATGGGLIPVSVYRFALLILVYCYGVVYLGAYIRHTHSSGGCMGWPLCNGEFVPELSGSTAVAFAHRVAALLLLLLIIALVAFVRRRTGAGSEPSRLAYWSLVLAILQVLSGGMLAYTLEDPDVYVFTSLLHTIIISALFSVLCLLAIRAGRLSRTKEGRISEAKL